MVTQNCKKIEPVVVKLRSETKYTTFSWTRCRYWGFYFYLYLSGGQQELSNTETVFQGLKTKKILEQMWNSYYYGVVIFILVVVATVIVVVIIVVVVVVFDVVVVVVVVVDFGVVDVVVVIIIWTIASLLFLLWLLLLLFFVFVQLTCISQLQQVRLYVMQTRSFWCCWFRGWMIILLLNSLSEYSTDFFREMKIQVTDFLTMDGLSAGCSPPRR